MTFVAPGWIGLAALASLAIVAIHLIAWRLPRTVVLPTARFVPDEPARRAARTVRLADVGLLALRVVLVMIGGLAMARPVFQSRPSGSATVIAVDASGDSAARQDSVRTIPRGDRTSLLVFDTTARVVTESSAGPPSSESSLTVGLLAAIREARRLEHEYDTVRIVLVAPFVRSSFDNATNDGRATWPDAIRLIRIPPPARASIATGVAFTASGDDPVVAGIRLALANGLIRGQSRVIREGPGSPPDSGQALVLWPRRSPNDSQRVSAIYAGDVTAIAAWIPVPLADSGRVIARWVNGAPAAREVVQRGGCVRNVGFDVPDVGDFVLTPSFQRLAAELLAPCGGRGESELVPDSIIASLSTAPPYPSAPVLLRDDSRNRVAALVMLLAALLGMVELLVRRRSAPVIVEERA
jgi:hypothetical protein